MLTYNCRVTDLNGNIINLVYTAYDLNELNRRVISDGYTLLSSEKKSRRTGIKIKQSGLLQFTKTLSLLLSSNLSIKDSVNIISTTFKDKNLKILATIISRGLNKGDSFYSILKNSGVGFSPLYLGLIKVGEKTGTLNIILSQLDRYMERNKRFRDKLTGAIIYPCFISIMTCIFSLMFVLFILPKFNEMFNSLGGGLGSVLKVRGQILFSIVLAFSALLILSFFFTLYIKTVKKSNYIKVVKYEEILLKLPLLGGLILEHDTLNLIFALSVLAGSSLNIEDALDYGKDVLNNSCLKLEVVKIKDRVLIGESLSSAFLNSLFPIRISSFIIVGERTGDLTEILNQLTEFYLKESDKKVERFMAVIDPVFTMLIGTSLFFLILFFILPVLGKMGDLL
jgi:type II secretory pathway component PulF